MAEIALRDDINKSGVLVSHLVSGPESLRAFGVMMSNTFGPAIAEVFHGANDGQVYVFAEPVDAPEGRIEFRLVCERVTKEQFSERLLKALEDSPVAERYLDLSRIDIFVICELHTVTT